MTKRREKELSGLSRQAQVAFAAICAERAIQEGARFCPQDLRNDKKLTAALKFAWRFVNGEKVDYAAEAEELHHDIAARTPVLDEGGDPVLTEVMSAVARTLVIFQQPDRAAAASRSAADCDLNLMSLVYEDFKAAEANERAWQDEALKRIKATGTGPIQRDLFMSIPDWPRGPAAKAFKNRVQKR